jgi:Flp pilus assembly protein TadD
MIPYKLGFAFMTLGELDAAEQNIRPALDNGFEEADAWNNLGLICRDRGKVEAAERAFREALEVDPQY